MKVCFFTVSALILSASSSEAYINPIENQTIQIIDSDTRILPPSSTLFVGGSTGETVSTQSGRTGIMYRCSKGAGNTLEAREGGALYNEAAIIGGFSGSSNNPARITGTAGL